ncbi:hypothetical protein [Clostridium magnum]|uniref:Uncharacterized protein n=1 Tax=Clostridium magnum DSM 2767 TaxID=1121326 RepID=A0A161WQE9_9CLOT|nr:hypothetical protein [Clostridium magnum]KZL88858.1 hypothetical protein CLMAG_57620 [Clostridium magnum DSM 2767]SHI50262.1 hypothetical protein SAMN02745944_04404 [Clostridium magnum DSM 2767]
MKEEIKEENLSLQKAYDKEISIATDIVLSTIEKSNMLENDEVIKQLGKDTVAEQIVTECKIDTDKLADEAEKIINNTPDISDQDLAIKLLSSVANNEKNKIMSKIARKMLNER